MGKSKNGLSKTYADFRSTAGEPLAADTHATLKKKLSVLTNTAGIKCAHPVIILCETLAGRIIFRA
jgi:hypothetical protein